jgi:hypothetical protein
MAGLTCKCQRLLPVAFFLVVFVFLAAAPVWAMGAGGVGRPGQHGVTFLVFTPTLTTGPLYDSLTGYVDSVLEPVDSLTGFWSGWFSNGGAQAALFADAVREARGWVVLLSAVLGQALPLVLVLSLMFIVRFLRVVMALVRWVKGVIPAYFGG